ncbi:hypothetical protein Glove_66g134 [Diversispora epigaea]|uniref:Uncharacterized protein n=1 Tax=Diversispora epigaea TaxID=1348612 RepID=A0A397JCS6_9GLOM|nr:hypothetical protein Glove_66g134 [Diversispora epigaea]
MPCYADTIVKIKVVRKTKKKDLKLVVVWTIGVYPVDCEDNEIEMVLFVPINSKEDVKRPKITISVSTGLTILNKAPNSNKCPLKISLVGVPQELLRAVEDDENAILNVLVDDYVAPNSNKCPLKISLVGVPQELLRAVEDDENAILNVLVDDYVVLDNDNTFSSKRVKIEPADKSVSVFDGVERSNDKINKIEATAKRRRHKKNICNNKKRKGSVSRSLCSTLKLNVDIMAQNTFTQLVSIGQEFIYMVHGTWYMIHDKKNNLHPPPTQRIAVFIPLNQEVENNIEDFENEQVIFLKGKFIAHEGWYSVTATSIKVLHEMNFDTMSTIGINAYLGDLEPKNFWLEVKHKANNRYLINKTSSINQNSRSTTAILVGIIKNIPPINDPVTNLEISPFKGASPRTTRRRLTNTLTTALNSNSLPNMNVLNSQQEQPEQSEQFKPPTKTIRKTRTTRTQNN